MERKILAIAINSKEDFTWLEKFNIINDLSDQAKIIYQLILEFYEQDSKAKSLDVDLLVSRISREFPKQKDIFCSIIRDLPDKDAISTMNLLGEIAALRKERLGRELSQKLLANHSDGVIELMEDYRGVEDALNAIENGDEVYQSKDIRELFSSISNENKLRLWPKSLNDAVGGGALPGHNILVFGRPESGKSLFTLNLSGGLLHDGKKVLYIENEDVSEVVLTRLVARLTGMTAEEVEKDPNKAQKLANDSGYENFILKSVSPGTFYEIQSLIDRYKPDVVIINQLRNLYVGNCPRVEQMERVATRARNLAKEYNIVVIGVTQAGDSADNKLVLEMGDIDFSNTGMPAQMDLIIGIGNNHNFEQNGRRMLSLPKNKLSGLHSYFPVAVDIKLSKIISI